MGRKGSKLIPFLKSALKEEKYSNLKFENKSKQIFSLLLPQNTNHLEDDCQFILRDWYKVKNRHYKLKKDYTGAKQGMEAALRKSDFLEVVHKGRNTELIYRILTRSEVEVKKTLKKAQKKASQSDPYLEYASSSEPSEYATYTDSRSAPSPESSGYGSGMEVSDDDSSHALLHAFNHDHKYIRDERQSFLNETLLLYNEENIFVNDRPSVGDVGLLGCDNILPFEQNPIGNMGIIGLLDNIFPDEIDSSITQDPLIDEINLNSTFDVDSSLMLNFNEVNMDEAINDLGRELCIDSQECAVKQEIPAISGLGVSSYRTETVKVYECLNRQNMPGMIMLTCEPKSDTQDIFENDTDNTLNVHVQPVKAIDAKKSIEERNVFEDLSGIEADKLAKPVILQKEDDCDIIAKRIALHLRQLTSLDLMDFKIEIQQILLKYSKKGLDTIKI